VFPPSIDLAIGGFLSTSPAFKAAWQDMMNEVCHGHSVWQSPFSGVLRDRATDPRLRFNLAATWSVNMLSGSYCFPRYVCALAARAEQDVTRYGLIENAWDEAGSYGHTARSHFWLAVELSRLLGLSDAEITRVRALPESQQYTDEHYRQCAEGEFEFALGMICLIEEFTTPEFTMIFKTFLHSCEVGLGMSPDDFILKGGAEYFTANIADDERHREEMPQIVAAGLRLRGVNLDDATAIRASLKAVRDGAYYSSSLRQTFFQGIFDFVRAGHTYRDLIGAV
jgi:pyrroloquinoline quinone (PQQ) biosynthesis protein C